jgi:hypothetical protein
MKGIVLLSGLLLNLTMVLSGTCQTMLTIRPEKPIVCYQSFENRPDHVGLSDKAQTLRQKGSGRVKTATIEVEYINFPTNNFAKTAFQFAVDIWETELVSSVPIRVRADWRPLTSGVLGQAIWGSAHANFEGAQHLNTFYPVALAEKIAGVEINEITEPDIVASFNSNASWYFGTDGNTPSGKMDMVTIVLHEIAHGLGFTDTYDVEGEEGHVGLLNGGMFVPFVFDLFVENGAGKNIFREFQSPSSALGTELQSASIFFDSPLSVVALTGTRPKLYAPSTFDNGSSISHLDESTFNSPQDANRLMTPQIAFAESIHDPGTVLLAMLSDMGWVSTSINHAPLKDTERKDGEPYVITVTIRSDNGYDPATLKVHYTVDGVNFTVASMNSTGVPDQFTFALPGTTVERAYAYYISVDDVTDRTFTHPGAIQLAGEAPQAGTHYFKIGADVDGPVIFHEPVTFIAENSQEVLITAEATDNLGVKEVFLEYRFNAGAVEAKTMQRVGTSDMYTATITLPALSPEDVLEYRLVASDLASSENVTVQPENDFYVVDVTGVMPVQDSYSNTFDDPTSDFFGEGFTVITPTSFTSGAIHSDHPYENGTGPNNESNYTYQLQIPIRINEDNPRMRFDEIVLVEPGEEGSVFGGEGFFDYVVVEGSADGGLTWKPFVNGYDSRANGVWLSRYNTNVVNDNSGAAGDPTLFRQRLIDMLESGDFLAGDEVIIRFRMFADQFAHGWGWAIDNLFIQAPVTGIEQPLSKTFQFYPVPAREELFLEFTEPSANPLFVSVYDAMGRTVYAQVIPARAGPAVHRIDLRLFQPGMYFIKARNGDSFITGKFLRVDN